MLVFYKLYINRNYYFKIISYEFKLQDLKFMDKMVLNTALMNTVSVKKIVLMTI